jgi:hypothetical protein
LAGLLEVLLLDPDALRRLVWALVMQTMSFGSCRDPAAPIRLPEEACHDWGVSPMRL